MVKGIYSLAAAAERSPHEETGERPCSGRSRNHKCSSVPLEDGKTDVLRSEMEQMIETLRDRQDEAREYCSGHGESADNACHFARICRANGQLPAVEQQRPRIKKYADIEEVASWEVEKLRRSVTPSPHLDPLVEWQESFDEQVKKLFIDFELTSSPNNRLNHLERMHDWFSEHGRKQTRKSKKGPSFLTADRTHSVPPGSTANVPRLDLASTSDHAFSAPFYSPGLSSRSSRRGRLN